MTDLDDYGFRNRRERREYVMRLITHVENGSRLSVRDQKTLENLSLEEGMLEIVSDAYKKARDGKRS